MMVHFKAAAKLVHLLHTRDHAEALEDLVGQLDDWSGEQNSLDDNCKFAVEDFLQGWPEFEADWQHMLITSR